jgi:hypothetical protein
MTNRIKPLLLTASLVCLSVFQHVEARIKPKSIREIQLIKEI